MKPCAEYDVLLTEYAAGALPDPDAAAVAAHVADCPGCRREVGATEAALRGAALPPPSELERRALADLPADALAALRRTERRRLWVSRAQLAAIAACAAALLLGVPELLRSRPEPVTATVNNSGVVARPFDAAPPTDPLTPGTARSQRVPDPGSSGVSAVGPGVRVEPRPRLPADGGAAAAFDSAPAAIGDPPAAAGPRVRRWVEPDLDELWYATDVLEVDGAVDL